MLLDLSLKLSDVRLILRIRSGLQPVVWLPFNLHFNDPGEEGNENDCQDESLEDGSKGVDVDGVVVEVQPGALLQPLREIVVADQLFEGFIEVGEIHNERLLAVIMGGAVGSKVCSTLASHTGETAAPNHHLLTYAWWRKIRRRPTPAACDLPPVGAISVWPLSKSFPCMGNFLAPGHL